MWRIGEVVDDRYEVTRVHEHGGMGLVHKVRHLAWDIDLAVKSPRPDWFQSPEDQRRFVAEAETWVSLGLHPHVCNCYYVRVLDGVPRVFAEYVPGGNLHEWINDRRLYRGSPREVLARILDVAIQTAWGLGHAHGHGLVHRDVKPANVLLDIEDGGAVTAKVTDFGLARAWASPSTGLPMSGGSLMTPLYASPEQAAGGPVEQRTDIYSFAVSVLEMCCGEATWPSGPFARVALTGRAGAVAIPQALGDLLWRCLHQNPAERPDAMADVATGLIDIYREATGQAYSRPVPVMADLLTDELNNRAVSLLDLDRQADADQAFAQALAADPQNVRAMYNAGLAKWRRGAITDDALVAEIEAISADVGDPWEVRYALAQIHLERGDLGKARELLDDVATHWPDEPEVLAALHLIRSEEIVDARCTREWPVSWPRRMPDPDPWLLDNPDEDQFALALSPDGRFAVSGGRDGDVRFWDVHSGQALRTIQRHRRPLHAVDLTPDGRFAVSVCEDETVWFWELSKSRWFNGSPKGRRLFASPNPPSWDGRDGIGELALRVDRTAVRLTPDGRFALYAGLDGVLRAWNTHSGQTKTLDKAAAGRLVAVSADGRWALCGGWRGDRERVVRLWDLADGRCCREFAWPDSALTALCLSADGRFAAAGSHGGTMRVWDLGDGRCVQVLTGGITPHTLSLDVHARFLLSGGYEEIRLWELDSGRCLRTFRAHRRGTSVVQLDADAQCALSIGQDRLVRQWTLPGEYRSPQRLSRPRRPVELSRLGGQVDALVAEAEEAMTAGRFRTALDLLQQARATEGYERAPRVMSAWWTLGRRAVRTGLRSAWSSRAWRTGELSSVDLSGDGRVGVSGENDGAVRLWDVNGGTCLQVFKGHDHMVESVRLSLDGRFVLSSSRDRTVRLWETSTGMCLHILHHTRGGLPQSVPVRFSPDGRQAVAGGSDGRIRYWDLETGDLVREVGNAAWGIDDMCLGDDGRLVVTAKGGEAEVRDLTDAAQPLHRLRGVRKGVLAQRMRSVSLSADGRLALCGDDHGIQLWNTTTGRVLRTFDQPPEGFHTVRMTADGRFAVSGGYWSYATVWDTHSGETVRVLDGHEQGAGCLALTPDGRFLLTGKDKTLRLWELDWKLSAKDAADWDAGAALYLERFSRLHGRHWTDKDFDALLRRLQDVGYGWLRAEGVRDRLDRMT